MWLLDKSFFGFGTQNQKSNILMKLFFTLATQRLNTLNQIGRRKNNRFSQVLTVYNLAMEKMFFPLCMTQTNGIPERNQWKNYLRQTFQNLYKKSDL